MFGEGGGILLHFHGSYDCLALTNHVEFSYPPPKLLYSICCNMLLRLKLREAYAASEPLLSNV